MAPSQDDDPRLRIAKHTLDRGTGTKSREAIHIPKPTLLVTTTSHSSIRAADQRSNKLSVWRSEHERSAQLAEARSRASSRTAGGRSPRRRRRRLSLGCATALSPAGIQPVGRLRFAPPPAAPASADCCEGNSDSLSPPTTTPLVLPLNWGLPPPQLPAKKDATYAAHFGYVFTHSLRRRPPFRMPRRDLCVSGSIKGGRFVVLQTNRRRVFRNTISLGLGVFAAFAVGDRRRAGKRLYDRRNISWWIIRLSQGWNEDWRIALSSAD